eukprot:augustus_masked-scaffold_103-processed-gene-0.28-mRNA-1 protein AED:1.00 eAED:1.00 QI:0/0/0/0/1/1/3/0/611
MKGVPSAPWRGPEIEIFGEKRIALLDIGAHINAISTDYFNQRFKRFENLQEYDSTAQNADGSTIKAYEQEATFTRIKKLLVEAAGLLHPDFNKEFNIMTDSSDYAIGGILFQNGGKRKVRVLGYFSKTLKPTQQKYSIVEKEALGVIRSLEVFRPIIFGLKITVFIDQKALVSLLFKDSSTKYARYREILGGYDVTLKYVEGDKNKSDWLSHFSTGLKLKININKQFSPKDWSEAVFNSESFVISMLKETDIQRENTVGEDTFYKEAIKAINNELPSFKVDNKKYTTSDFKFENTILRYLGRIYVPVVMGRFIANIINGCNVCKIGKNLKMKVTPSVIKEHDTLPFEFIHLDLYGFGTLDIHNMYQGAMAIVDSATGFTMYIPMKSKGSNEVIEALLNKWFIIFGFPSKIRTDQEKCFMSHEFKEFARKFNFDHSVSGIYDHAQNGVAERSLKYLGVQLRCMKLMDKENKLNWPKLLRIVTTRKNAAFSKACKDTPYHAVFGVDWRYELGLKENILNNDEKRLAEKLKEKELEDRRVAADTAWKASKKKTETPIIPGTLVWWLNPTLRKFDSDVTIWRVVKVVGSNLYEVKSLENDDTVKVSGRNLVPLVM